MASTDSDIEMIRNLHERGLVEKQIAPDGNCFYLAVADQLIRLGLITDGTIVEEDKATRWDTSTRSIFNLTDQHLPAARILRRLAANFVRDNFERFQMDRTDAQFKRYIRNQRKNGIYAGEEEMIAISEIFRVELVCLTLSNDGYTNRSFQPAGDLQGKITLILDVNHFSSTQKIPEGGDDEEEEEEEDNVLQVEEKEIDGVTYWVASEPIPPGNEDLRNTVYDSVTQEFVGHFYEDSDTGNVILLID